MKTKILIALLFCFVCAFFFLKKDSFLGSEHSGKIFPRPADGTIISSQAEENEAEEHQNLRELWFEGMHRAAPGINWRSIEEANMKQNAAYIEEKMKTQTSGSSQPDSYGGGLVDGTWHERGANNQAGRCIAVDYYRPTNALYVIGNDGAMFKGTPDSAVWSAIGTQYRFSNKVLKVISNGSGGTRIIAAIGLNMYYSDNAGVTWIASTGITFPTTYAGNGIYQVVALNDTAETLYATTQLWDSVPNEVRFWAYRSTDRGITWTKFFTFPDAHDHLRMWVPTGSTTTVYALINESTVAQSTMYTIVGTTLTATHPTQDLPCNVSLLFTGVKGGNATTMYALTDGTKLYISMDLGLNWTYRSAPLTNGYSLSVSQTKAQNVQVGSLNAFYSINGGIGSSWTLVNDWSEYYGSPSTKLHADLYAMASFKRTNGTEFTIINSDGGCYRSDDSLASVANISLTGLRNAEYYDVKSDPLDAAYLYAASQDQGFQRASLADNSSVIDFAQVTSGDYVKLQLSRSSLSLWSEFPGGQIYYYNDSHGALSNFDFTVPGTYKPNYGWQLPTAPVYPSTNNQIFIGGGNTSGGDGSHLMKLTAATTSPYNVTATQYLYDFKPNSGVTAIGSTSLNTSKIYVATGDGSFFYSNDSGTTWTKTANFSGPPPPFLLGTAILASKNTAGLVFFGGSGYSNPSVYKSTDGGITFTAVTSGLPSTLVYDMVYNPNETLIFAGTEAGPYVYVVSANLWYPLTGTTTPAVPYIACDYDVLRSKVHFATYGRGIWDFDITLQP